MFQISYKTISSITSFVALLLCFVLIVIPELLFLVFDLPLEHSAITIGKRMAMLFLGLAVMSWMSRNSGNTSARRAMCMGFCVSMFSLATLGSFEFYLGTVGVGIFIAVITEVVIGLGYLQVWLREGDNFN